MERFVFLTTLRFQGHQKVSKHIDLYLDFLLLEPNFILDVMEKPATPAEFIELISQEKYDEIQKIESADKKCEDSVLVSTFNNFQAYI